VPSIVVETTSAGHLGKVQSNQPNTIYRFSQSNQSSIGRPSKEEQVIQEIAKTLAHEAGHLISKFKAEKAPQSKKEREFEQRVGF